MSPRSRQATAESCSWWRSTSVTAEAANWEVFNQVAVINAHTAELQRLVIRSLLGGSGEPARALHLFVHHPSDF